MTKYRIGKEEIQLILLQMIVLIISSILSSIILNKYLIKKYYPDSKRKMEIQSLFLLIVFLGIIGYRFYPVAKILNKSLFITVINSTIMGIVLGSLSSSYIVDVYFKELPDENNIIIGIGMFALSLQYYGYQVIISSIILFSIFFIVALLTDQFGMGDVKMMFFMGFGLYPHKISQFLFSTFFLATIYALVLIIIKKNKMKDSLPLGPFLIYSFLNTMLWLNS